MLLIEVGEKNVEKVEGDQEAVHHQMILIVINVDIIKRAEKHTKSHMTIQTGNTNIVESIISSSTAIVSIGFDQVCATLVCVCCLG